MNKKLYLQAKGKKMKCFIPLFFLLLASGETRAQASSFEGRSSYFFSSNSETIQSGLVSSRTRLLSPDRQQNYRPSSLQLYTVSASMYQAETYWMSTMTTQSYNQGKIGRFYLWDVQGNLRESKMFIDISGKNKRGLKLVFSKLRFGL